MAKSPDAFRTISEVAEWLSVPTHVLRFWESRFTQVKPVKRAGGRRYYRPADMELLGGIKRLLHDDGLTIRGVQKLLREEGVRHVSALSPTLDPHGDPIGLAPADNVVRLRAAGDGADRPGGTAAEDGASHAPEDRSAEDAAPSGVGVADGPGRSETVDAGDAASSPNAEDNSRSQHDADLFDGQGLVSRTEASAPSPYSPDAPDPFSDAAATPPVPQASAVLAALLGVRSEAVSRRRTHLAAVLDRARSLARTMDAGND